MTGNWKDGLHSYLKWLLQSDMVKGPWVVGVSGGADSLALVFLLHEFSLDYGVDLTALTVQHGLRPEAEEEAQYVANLMKKNGIKHHILYWKGQKPQTGIEAAAREARYHLMSEWCYENQVQTMMIAHHMRDQAETFLMRLQRGSGVDGLSAMAPISKWHNLYVVRPLLHVAPEDLKDYLRQKNIAWVEDLSNDCDDFLRVKIRKLLPTLEDNIGLSRERLCHTALEMARVRDYLEKVTEKFITQHVSIFEDCGVCLTFHPFLELHEEIGLRVLRTLLKRTAQKIYAPCMEEVERLWEALHGDVVKGRTLGYCEIFVFQKKIWIVPENKGHFSISKQDWDDFCVKNPNYRNKSLPYKLRCRLVEKSVI